MGSRLSPRPALRDDTGVRVEPAHPRPCRFFSGGKFFARLQELSREKEDMFEVEVNRFAYVRQKDLRLPRVFDRRGLRVLRTSDMRARRFANKQTVLFLP